MGLREQIVNDLINHAYNYRKKRKDDSGMSEVGLGKLEQETVDNVLVDFVNYVSTECGVRNEFDIDDIKE